MIGLVHDLARLDALGHRVPRTRRARSHWIKVEYRMNHIRGWPARLSPSVFSIGRLRSTAGKMRPQKT